MLYIEEVDYQSPAQICHRFANQPGTIFLDSARLQAPLGRYSFIAIDPFQRLQSESSNDADPFIQLEQTIKQYQLEPIEELPPFQGGIAGYFSYDLRHRLETLPKSETDLLQFPELVVGFYDLVLGFDELDKRAWIFSSGFPETLMYQRKNRAKLRCQWLKTELAQTNTSLYFAETSTYPPIQLESNFTKASYEQAVQKTIDYIKAGDIFEANISQRFLTHLPQDFDVFNLYARLRQCNPAPFSAFMNAGETVLASASPERFLKLSNSLIETRPIKGTRPRNSDPVIDKQLADELENSEKDRAENIMIVDLMRNDLSRVCEASSVVVPQLCGLESYATVHHLVSAVEGKLKANKTMVDLLKATFPGGSITGAPKIRAMEIISEIEKTSRGPYCGSIGYLGFNGNMDTSISIRTFAIKNNVLTFQAGGAVVLDSEPTNEYEESLAKADALIKTLLGNDNAYDFSH